MYQAVVPRTPKPARTRRKVGVYGPNDELAGPPWFKVAAQTATAFVEQGLASWCNGGEVLRLKERTASASPTRSSVTHVECLANVGLGSDEEVASAKCKVNVWLLVGVDAEYGQPTRAPLPAQRGIKCVNADELQRLSSTPLPFVGHNTSGVRKQNKRQKTSLDRVWAVDRVSVTERCSPQRLEEDVVVRQTYYDFAQRDDLEGNFERDAALLTEVDEHDIDN
jgi:hypothetical protein